MPSESCRRRRNRRPRGRRTGTGRQTAQASELGPQLEEATDVTGTILTAAGPTSSTSTNPTAATTAAARVTYAERVKRGTSPCWRPLGPTPSSSRQTSRFLFAEIEKKPLAKTLLDFNNGSDPNKRSLYIPPPMRNRRNSGSMSFIQTSEVAEVVDIPANEPNGAAAALNFVDSELQTTYQESIVSHYMLFTEVN